MNLDLATSRQQPRRHDRPAGSPAAGVAELRPAWWSPGLTLAERAALGGPVARRVAEDRRERAIRRLRRWKDQPGLAASGKFEQLLAAGVTEGRLLELLAEDPGDLARRAPKPGWATLAEAAVERAPLEPESPGTAAGAGAWQSGFATILSPFLEEAKDRLRAVHAARPGIGPAGEHLHHGPVAGLARRLEHLAARTLVLELNVFRVTGRLAGDTPEARFWSFVRHLRGRAGFVALVEEYPVLARLLATAVQHAVESWAELLDRLAADRAAIVEHLMDGADPGAVVTAHGAGDTHAGGRAVTVVKFESGARVVYKPRPVGIQRHYNELAAWLDGAVPGLGPARVPLLDRGRYGWVRFVDHLPCSSRDGLTRYYERLGATLALVYALDATDVHYENLIAHGDQPVVIDLETLFHPAPLLRAPGTEDDPALAAMERSVSYTGLLPMVVHGEEGTAIDMSGAGGDDGARLPFKSLTWTAPGTDEMWAVRKHATLHGSRNRPRLGDQVADPADYLENLLDGFRRAYRALLDHRDELVGETGWLRRFAGDEIRVVLRSTQDYGTLALESTHPDVMRDALDRDAVLTHLWTLAEAEPETLRAVVTAELADLWSGDVPLFTVRVGDGSLAGSRAGDLGVALPETPLERALDKIAALDDADLHRQEWLIRASMVTRRSAIGVEPYQRGEGRAAPATAPATVPAVRRALPDGGVDGERALAAAREVADRIVETAYLGADTASWLGLMAIDDTRWTVAPLQMDLYSGCPGVALFLAQLARLTGKAHYADLARRVVRRIDRVVEALSGLAASEAVGPSGGFQGCAAIAYCLDHVAAELGEPPPVEQISVLLDAAARGVDGDTALDVIGGSAGCLAATLALAASPNLAKAGGVPNAAGLARACADRLARTARPQERGVAWEGGVEAERPLTGFSHGTAGIGWALLRYAAAGGERSYADLALAAFAYERGQYHAEDDGWLDYRVFPEGLASSGAGTPGPGVPDQKMNSWCHGAAGIGLARADGLRHTADPALAADLELALASHLRTPPMVNHSLCHGELGNLELLTAAVAAGRADLAEARARRAAWILETIERAGPVCGTPDAIPTPALMCGLAGIGHGLLRLGFPDRVPSVLLLEPSRGR